METKFIALDLKADPEARTVEGLGSVFGNVDSYGDIVVPGAFAKSLASRQPMMLWQHKSDHVIGIWDEARETGDGLWLKGRILQTTHGNDAYELARHGAIKGLSIGFVTKDSAVDRKSGHRHLKTLDLHEVSLVTFPANDKANLTRVKSAPDNERDFEEFLREAGYARDAAKIIVARGFKALNGQREAEVEAHTRLQTLINSLT